MTILECSQIVVTTVNVFFYDGEDHPVMTAETPDDIRKAIESIRLLESQKLIQQIKADNRGVIFVPTTMFCDFCGKLMQKFPKCKRCLSCGNLVTL